LVSGHYLNLMTRTRRLAGEGRREVVIQAVIGEVARGGLHGTGTEAIARRVASRGRTCSCWSRPEGARPGPGPRGGPAPARDARMCSVPQREVEMSQTTTRGRPLWTFLVTGLALFMVSLDSLVVTNALPSIRADLGTGIEGLEWTVSAYTLTFAVFLLTGAALGDRWGRRPVFLAGLAGFTAASAACAGAPDIGTLVAARAVQGVGAALVTPLTLTLLAAAVPRERRGLAFGAWSGMGGLAVALGPVVGGAITESASWQWIFWINVPVGVLLLPVAALRLADSRGPAARLDLLGTVLATAGLFGVVLGLVRGNGHGWTSPLVLTGLIGGSALLATFLAWERRTAAPMLPLRVFASRGFSVTIVASLAMSFGMLGSVFLLAQFLQGVQHYSPLAAGVRTLPWTAMPVLAAPLAGLLSDRVGPHRLVVAGLVLQAAGLGWLAVVTAPDVPYPALVPGFVLSGFGMGIFLAPVARLALGFVEPAL